MALRLREWQVRDERCVRMRENWALSPVQWFFQSAVVSSIFLLPAHFGRGDLSRLLQLMQQIQYRLILHLS